MILVRSPCPSRTAGRTRWTYIRRRVRRDQPSVGARPPPLGVKSICDGTIVTHIARDRGDGRRGSSGNSKIGQRAVTHLRWMQQLGDYSLVECRLETGRTNQIRIHLSEKGHLVCGDVKYRQPFAATAIDDVSGAPRLALHAAELGFVHPLSQAEVFFTMPLPPDLERFVQRLRRHQERQSR